MKKMNLNNKYKKILYDLEKKREAGFKPNNTVYIENSCNNTDGTEYFNASHVE